MTENTGEPKNNNDAESTQSPLQIYQITDEPSATDSPNRSRIPLLQIEEPLIDILEEDHVRILMRCRCREQEVTFYVCADGIRICRKECHVNGLCAETCTEKC